MKLRVLKYLFYLYFILVFTNHYSVELAYHLRDYFSHDGVTGAMFFPCIGCSCDCLHGLNLGWPAQFLKGCDPWGIFNITEHLGFDHFVLLKYFATLNLFLPKNLLIPVQTSLPLNHINTRFIPLFLSQGQEQGLNPNSIKHSITNITYFSIFYISRSYLRE